MVEVVKKLSYIVLGGLIGSALVGALFIIIVKGAEFVK